MNAATARMTSQAFLPRNFIISPALRKIKLTIAPRRPGIISPIFFPRVFKPFPIPPATLFNPFESELIITPIVAPTARAMAPTVKPYFRIISFFFHEEILVLVVHFLFLVRRVFYYLHQFFHVLLISHIHIHFDHLPLLHFVQLNLPLCVIISHFLLQLFPSRTEYIKSSLRQLRIDFIGFCK